MTDEFFRISGFWPSGSSMGGFGFGVSLDQKFALNALETKLSNEQRERFQKEGMILFKKLRMDEFGQPRSAYCFYEDTSLLQFCTVPGDACDLGIDGIELSYFAKDKKKHGDLNYNPHNVDSVQQAYALLSLWLNWSEHLRAIQK